MKQAMDHLHSLYTGLDLLRAGLVLVASVLLMRSARRGSAAATAAALGLLVVAPGCAGPAVEVPAEGKAPSKAETSAKTEAETRAPRREAFVADLAWQHLETIVAMGPRLDGFPGHDKFRQYVAREFEKQGWTVTEQPFTYQVPGEDKLYELANVSALLGPRDENTVLLGTHYDTRPWSDEETDPALRRRPVLGANDGGSGVAVLLEIARVLAEDPPEHGVEIVLFDGEDLGRPGHPEEYSQGAQHLVNNWSEIQGGAPYPAEVVVIDMVGDIDLEFFPEAESMRKSPEVTSRIWQAAHRIGYGKYFQTRSARGVWDDHRPFLAADIPAALIIDLDYEPWHTVRDTLDKCSPTSLEITGQVVLEGVFPR